MISKVQNWDYELVFFEDLDIHISNLILRHNIDLSLESALKMATFFNLVIIFIQPTLYY